MMISKIGFLKKPKPTPQKTKKTQTNHFIWYPNKAAAITVKLRVLDTLRDETGIQGILKGNFNSMQMANGGRGICILGKESSIFKGPDRIKNIVP